MKEFNKIFFEIAKKANACDKGMSAIPNCSKDELIKLFVDNIDFTTDNPNWLSNSVIKENFTHEELQRNGLYVDVPVNIENPTGTIVLKGKCCGYINLSEYHVCSIYCLDESNVKIVCSDLSKCFISVHGKSMVQVEQSDMAKCYVYKKSESSMVSTSGEVIVKK